MSSNLATQEPLLEVLCSIEHKLVQLGWLVVTREGNRRTSYLKEPRLIAWAIACLERDGIDSQMIAAALAKTPVEKRWWFLRQMLPEAALRALNGRLDGQLAQGGSYAAPAA